MMTKVYFTISIILTLQGCHCGTFLDMLDGMQQLMTGDAAFDRAFYADLSACFDQFDPKLLPSQDAQWAGMLAYANSGGDPAAGDIWLGCDEQRWFEHNCTVQEFGGVPIHEPCNYASNVAYYHTAMEVCKRSAWAMPQEFVTTMLRAFSFLGQGSAFFHVSQTNLGLVSDRRTMDLFTYTIHQGAVQSLLPLDSSIIHELSYTPREKSSVVISEDLLDTYMELPVEQWTEALTAIDMPEIRLGFCGFLSTVGILALEEEAFDAIIEWAFANIGGLDDELKELCVETFVPLVRNATEHILLTDEERQKLYNHFLATIAKFLYAFIWQEEEIVPGLGDVIFTPEANEIGATLLPIFNDLANLYLSYEYHNPSLQHGVGIYPGEEWCNPRIPHAKWHLQAGIALADLVFLADEVRETIDRFKGSAGDGMNA